MKYKSKARFSQVKSSISSRIAECKGRLIAIIVILFLTFIAGIVVYCLSPTFYPSNEYLLSYNGVSNGIGAFFSREASLVFVMTICFVTTLSKWSSVIGVLVVGFRGYLLGFNICALCSNFGFAGSMQAILIIIPCGLAMLLGLGVFLALISKANSLCSRYGSHSSARGKLFIIFLLILTAINLIETILLGLLSSNVILVI